mgnify:CR=1 FL=1
MESGKRLIYPHVCNEQQFNVPRTMYLRSPDKNTSCCCHGAVDDAFWCSVVDDRTYIHFNEFLIGHLDLVSFIF